MPTVIDSLIVELGLDPKDFKAGTKIAEKDLLGIAKYTKKLRDQQSREEAASLKQKAKETEKANKLQLREQKEQERQNRKTSDSFGDIRNQALALFGVYQAGKNMFQGAMSTIASNTNLAYMSDTVGISASRLQAWQDAAEKTGSSASEMADQIRKANTQIGAVTQGLQDAEFGEYTSRGGAAGKALTDPELLLRAKADLVKSMTADLGLREAQVAAQRMGIGPGAFNMMKVGGDALIEQINATEKMNNLSPEAAALSKKFTANLVNAEIETKRFFTASLPTLNLIMETTATTLKSLNDMVPEAQKTFVRVYENVDALSHGKKLQLDTTTIGGKYIGKARKIWLENMATEIAREQGIDPNILKSVIDVEDSSWDPNAVNPKTGAAGLGQIIESNFKALGITDPFDPDQNLTGAAKLIKENMKRYKGDLPKALAAYNSNPTHVDKEVKELGADWLKGMPTETQNYIPQFQSHLSGRNSVNIQSMTVTLPSVHDAKGFKEEVTTWGSHNSIIPQVHSGFRP